MPNFIKIGRTVAEIWWCNGFFQNGSRPPSWICWAPTGTTVDDHLVVSVVVPNLVKIDAVVSITWNFQYFARLAWKRLFTPPKLGFLGFHPEHTQYSQYCNDVFGYDVNRSTVTKSPCLGHHYHDYANSQHNTSWKSQKPRYLRSGLTDCES